MIHTRKILLLSLMCVTTVLSVHGQGKKGDFAKFLDAADAAQRELQNGKPDAYKALWSKADDVTLSGGFGGKIEKGWTAVSGRLDWAATQFNNGSNTIERISVGSNGTLGFIVQIEHIKFSSPSGESATRDLRVTMVFRKEHGKWRIIHRHGDAQTARVPA